MLLLVGVFVLNFYLRASKFMKILVCWARENLMASVS